MLYYGKSEVRTMEALLKQFMEQMNKRFDEIALEQNEMRKEIGEIKAEQAEMRKEIGAIKTEQAEMRKEIGEIKAEQAEMRKEIAFYYGSMMREIDNTRIEARSQFKHLEVVIDRHRGAIELLGKRTKTPSPNEN